MDGPVQQEEEEAANIAWQSCPRINKRKYN
jgi:hypothetical protein